MKKRLLAIVLVVAMLFSMAACAPTIDEASMSAYENYAILAAKQDTYDQYEDIEEVLILTGEELKTALGTLPGQMEEVDLKKAGALVLIFTEKHDRYFLIDGAAATDIYTTEKKEGETENKDDALDSGKKVLNNALVLYKGGSNYSTAAASQDPASELKSTYQADPKLTASELRWDLAQKEVDYENFLKKAAVEKSLAPYKERMEAAKKEANYFHSEAWLRLCNENTNIKSCHNYEREIYRLKGWLSIRESYEKDNSVDKDTKYQEALLAFMEDYNDEQNILTKKLTLAGHLVTMDKNADVAAAAEASVADQLAALQKQHGDDYMLTLDYYVLRQIAIETATANKKSSAYNTYENARYYVQRYKVEIAAMEQENAAENAADVAYITATKKEQLDYMADFRSAASAYAKTKVAYDKYLAANQADVDTYNAEVAKIKDKYQGASYENDLDYMKLQLRYKSLLDTVSGYVEDLEEQQKKIDDRAKEHQDSFQKNEETKQNTLKAQRVGRDKEKILAVVKPLADSVKSVSVESGNRDKYDSFVLDPDREGWVVSSPEYANDLEDYVTRYIPPKTNSGSSSGGSSGKTCAKAGCTKKAVTSGDSIYCATHSNRCGSCGCYIDGDAMYCMDCIKKALKK